MEFKQLIEPNRAGIFSKWGKTEEDVQKDVTYLKEWIKKQAHLPLMEDWRLEVMLIRCKFSLENTKKRIDRFYTIRSLEPEIFSDWDPLSTSHITAMKLVGYVTMPKLTKDLCQVSICRFVDPNPEDFQPFTFCKLSCMFIELQLKNYYYYGNHVIFDMTGTKFGHIIKVNPALLIKHLYIATEAYPYKIKGLHCVNANSMLSPVLKLGKMVLSEKLYKMIYIHNDYESLHKVIPKEILPVDYGGDLPPFIELNERWRAELKRSGRFFANELTFKTDESKRKGKIDENIFGSIDGSFRTLQID